MNLKWEVGGVAEKSYQRSRDHSPQRDKSISPRTHSHVHRQHHQSEFNNQPTPIPTSTVPKQQRPPPTQPIAYYYPYAYPPMPAYQQPVEKSQRMNRSQGRIKQSDKSVNLVRNYNALKIEHHYVDSPNEAQKLIDDLRRKGFIETGIETPGIYHNKKMN